MSTSEPAHTGAIRWREQLIAAGWLTLVWNLLLGDFRWANLLGGLAVALGILVFFPLPAITFGGRLRPLALSWFAAHFLVELVSASVHVALVAVRPGCRPRSAVLAVGLRVHSDLNLTLTAEVLSLVPGTLIIEVDRDAGILHVHVFDVRGPADLTASRRRIHDVERRLVRAVGSPAEVRQLSSAPPVEGMSE